MELDSRTALIVQISAATAANALPALRAAISEALKLGISKDEVQAVIDLAREVQQQPISHTANLAKQLLRDSISKSPVEVNRL